jgi:hypothetical protein
VDDRRVTHCELLGPGGHPAALRQPPASLTLAAGSEPHLGPADLARGRMRRGDVGGAFVLRFAPRPTPELRPSPCPPPAAASTASPPVWPPAPGTGLCGSGKWSGNGGSRRSRRSSDESRPTSGPRWRRWATRRGRTGWRSGCSRRSPGGPAGFHGTRLRRPHAGDRGDRAGATGAGPPEPDLVTRSDPGGTVARPLADRARAVPGEGCPRRPGGLGVRGLPAIELGSRSRSRRSSPHAPDVRDDRPDARHGRHRAHDQPGVQQ